MGQMQTGTSRLFTHCTAKQLLLKDEEDERKLHLDFKAEFFGAVAFSLESL